MTCVLNLPFQLIVRLLAALEQVFLHLNQPARYSIIRSTVADLTRSKSESIAENGLLRQQLIVLHRQIKKPSFSQSNRLMLVSLESRVKKWKASLLVFKPDTLLRRHCQGFRLFWKFKSRHGGGRPELSSDTIALIQQMAKENRLWGSERTPKARRTPHTPHPGRDRHHSEVRRPWAAQPVSFTNRVNLLAEALPGGLGR